MMRMGFVLLSMTGFGEARFQGSIGTLSIEVRTVNNRYLKVSVRGSEPYPMLEPELERTVRKYVRRGTVTIHIRLERQYQKADFAINSTALASYIEQIVAVCERANRPDLAATLVGHSLTLPGVAPEPGGVAGRPPAEESEAVEATLVSALVKLHAMRELEGRAMADELRSLRKSVAGHLAQVTALVPGVVDGFRRRLFDRVSQAIAEHNVGLRQEDVIREVAVFADRSDVSEEITRLASHLDQFDEVLRGNDESPGRKLEFLVQEMGREANTIGSKAGDANVSRHVVEIKAALEKVRELVQNVE